MTDAPTAAKLRFLNVSAHHYATIAPATSAHLMLMLHKNLEGAGSRFSLKEHERNRACKACGSILVPGRTSRVGIVAEGGARLKKVRGRKGGGDRRKSVRVECLVCHRFEKTLLERPVDKGCKEKKKKKKKGESERRAGAEAGAVDAAASQVVRPVTTNAGSKIRAKARKNGGLRAMLDRSRGSSNASAGFGLDLMDLMKQS